MNACSVIVCLTQSLLRFNNHSHRTLCLFAQEIDVVEAAVGDDMICVPDVSRPFTRAEQMLNINVYC